MATKFFTVEEANGLLDTVRPLLERIKELDAAIGQDQTLAVIREKAAQNGGGRVTRARSEKATALQRELKALEALGILLRDPAIGLIDFPHQRQGKNVFLCWKLGESRVEWWHPTDTGIAGRERL